MYNKKQSMWGCHKIRLCDKVTL